VNPTRVVVPAETAPHERRVACVPDAVGKLTAAGLSVVIESGAGVAAGYPDAAYVDAGASIGQRADLSTADVVLAVQPLPVSDAERLGEATVVLSFLQPAANPDLMAAFERRKVSALSLDRLPRISRAQSMDALSSQSLVAGYRAAIIAAEKLPRFFPLLMTAAGTVPPAKVLVLGAGVAGLQAIATARRLGAVVSAYDVRTAASEEVKSLGATFISLELESLEGAGGYAREMTEERAARQRELLTPHLAASDAVITTAAVPGRKAPLLVDAAMVEAMRPGTVLVDIAADSGGNCELSVAGEEILHNGVLIWGGRNMPSGMPYDASRLYARNLVNLLLLMTKDGVVTPNLDDEVVSGCLVVHAGEVRA
jgi:NAD(P) transhydrogenase subunit alpha